MSTMCDDEKAFHIDSYAQTHRCILRLFELNKMEQILDLLHSFNDEFALPPTPQRDPSSDTSMAEESREERLLRYLQSDQ